MVGGSNRRVRSSIREIKLERSASRKVFPTSEEYAPVMNRFLLFLWSITNYTMQLTHTYVIFGFGSFVSCARSGVGETNRERAAWEVGVALLQHQRLVRARATVCCSMRIGAAHFPVLATARIATDITAHSARPLRRDMVMASLLELRHKN